MTKTAKEKLYIQMFHGFSMTYGGKRLEAGGHDRSQYLLLLQTVLHYRKKGVDRKMLLSTLFDDQELDDVSHSLRNVLYITRKKLKELGLPDLEYIRKEKSTYYWTDEIEAVEDTEQFEQMYFRAMKEQDPEKKFTILKEAVALYQGRFLPKEEEAAWVLEERRRLQDIFIACIWKLDLYAESLNRYPELYEISTHASRVEPYTNLEVLTLKALIAMNHYEEAQQFYDSTVEAYAAKYGSHTAKKVQDLISYLDKYMMRRNEDLSSIQNRLTEKEDQGRGGFYCSFSVFQELFRNVERVMVRFGGYIYLMLCTLVDKDGTPIEDGEELSKYSDMLLNTLVKSVRHSDTITRYGKGQFLVLLFGTTEENCSIVTDRIDANFEKQLGEEAKEVRADYAISKVIADGQRSFPFFENVVQGPKE